MTTYKCPRCGYTTDRSSNLRNHVLKANLCPSTISDDDLVSLRQKFTTSKDSNTYECHICKKLFKTTQTLKRHQKKCETHDNKDAIIQQIACLLTKLSHIDHPQVTNINHIQNIQNNNIQINISSEKQPINVNEFLHENLAYISDDYILKCAKRLDNGLVDLIKTIRFNPEHPENMNVKIHVKRDKTVYVYNNGKWEICDSKWTLEEMIVQGARIIHQKFITHSDQDKLMEDGSSESKIQSWLLSLLPRNNDKLMGKLSKRLYALILSNQEDRDVVLLVEKACDATDDVNNQ